MNETLKTIENRKSVRKYAGTPISEEEKNLILHAAMRAPTAGNMMLYSIIRIEEQSLKDQLAETCDHQPFIAAAPWALLFVADYQRFIDYYQYCGVNAQCAEKGIEPRQPAEGDLLLACCDALIAAQTAVIAAESLGIGSCYIGDILENADTHRQMFKLPRYTLPITMVVFGRPAVEKTENRLTPRFPEDCVVFNNEYRPLTEPEFIRMFEAGAQRSHPGLPVEEAVKVFGQNQYFRKFAADFSWEMNRSSAEWIKTWKQG